MKKIMLIRHAEVDILKDEPFASSDLPKWVEFYDTADIVKTNLPPQSLVDEVQQADIVLCSELRRTHRSAEVLGAEIFEKNAIFNESDVPSVHIPYVKLRPKSWLLILRLLLILGLGKKDSALNRAKGDALNAVERLEALTLEHDRVVLVGHGGKNWLMKNILLKRGWKLEGRASTKNWGTMTFILG